MNSNWMELAKAIEYLMSSPVGLTIVGTILLILLIHAVARVIRRWAELKKAGEG